MSRNTFVEIFVEIRKSKCTCNESKPNLVAGLPFARAKTAIPSNLNGNRGIKLDYSFTEIFGVVNTPTPSTYYNSQD